MDIYMTMDQTVAAGQFKAKRLHLLDQVATQRTPLLITKRGKPVDRLVPNADAENVFADGKMG